MREGTLVRLCWIASLPHRIVQETQSRRLFRSGTTWRGWVFHRHFDHCGGRPFSRRHWQSTAACTRNVAAREDNIAQDAIIWKEESSVTAQQWMDGRRGAGLTQVEAARLLDVSQPYLSDRKSTRLNSSHLGIS